MNDLLQARESEAAPFVSLMQGPVKPWTTDDEAAEYARDPKAYLLKRCARVMKDIKLATNNILVSTFHLPEFANIRGPDGKSVQFFLADKTVDEAQWQGRVGLLLAKGPLAWKSDDRIDFGGCNYNIGDWVVYDRQDGRQISINRVHCRRLKDVDVWASTTDPMSVY